MISRFRMLPVLVVLALVDSYSWGQPSRGEDDPTKHGWMSSLEMGKVEAKRSGKPIMAVVRCDP